MALCEIDQVSTLKLTAVVGEKVGHKPVCIEHEISDKSLLLVLLLGISSFVGTLRKAD